LPMNNRAVAIDFDDTWWQTVLVWRTITGNPIFAYENYLTWNHPEQWVGSRQAFYELEEKAQTYEAMLDFEPMPGAVETLLELRAHGIDQTFLTARKPHELEAIDRISALHGYQSDRTVSRSSKEKVAYCLEHGIRLMLEDNPSTIEAAHEAGITVVSLRYPYNAEIIDRLGIAHGNSWAELRPILWRLFGIVTD
jgi:phosphoglycolate phosphatase-like HAD superfamily hydrolase